MFYGIGAFYGALGAIFAAGGIGSIQAKSWARILMIVLSSFWLGFGLLGTLGVAAMMPIMMRQQEAILQQNPAAQGGQLPPHFMGTVMVVTIAFQVVIMVLLPLVLLLFYTRKNVKATCEPLSNPPSLPLPATAVPAAPTAVASPTIPGAPATDSAKRGLPVPIVLAVMWFSFVAVSGLVTASWFPLAVVFGVKVQGVEARLILLALALLNGYCAWGFYKLRIAAWWTAVGLFVFSFLSGIMTAIKGTPSSLYEDAYRQMGMDPQQMRPFMLDAHTMQLLQSLGLLVFVAFFALLLYTRRYFRDAMTR